MTLTIAPAPAPPLTASEGSAPAVVFENVWLGFGEGDVLKGVNLRIYPRETLVLLGETGAGKTLLLKLAAGLLHPARGRVTVLGREVSAMRERELLAFRRQIGFVFQEGALFDSLTVADNVAYRLHQEGLEPAEIDSRVREALGFVELSHTADQLPSELSGGMRRRVSIARALIDRPPIVLYDSPTAGLDPVTSQTIITLILRLRDLYGVTALLATHRVQDGFALANYDFDPQTRRVMRFSEASEGTGGPVTRFAVLRDGAVYFEASPEQLARSSDPYLQRFLV